MSDIQKKAEEYAADCIGDYSPEYQQDFEDLIKHYLAGHSSRDPEVEELKKEIQKYKNVITGLTETLDKVITAIDSK